MERHVVPSREDLVKGVLEVLESQGCHKDSQRLRERSEEYHESVLQLQANVDRGISDVRREMSVVCDKIVVNEL